MRGGGEGEVAAEDLDAVARQGQGEGGAIAPHALVADLAYAGDYCDAIAEVRIVRAGGSCRWVGEGHALSLLVLVEDSRIELALPRDFEADVGLIS